MKTPKLRVCLLLTTLICGAGCVTGRNPLQGWKGGQSAYEGCPFDKMICEDYRRYIDTLSGEKKYVIDVNISFFEDGSGQRAVQIKIPINNKTRIHVLIYDSNSKRIKVIDYTSGWYIS